MFARSYLYLTHPFDEVRALVLRPPSVWLPEFHDGAGEQLLSNIGARLSGIPAYERVNVEVGLPRTRPGMPRVTFPVSWKAVGGAPLFPDMQGDLEVEAFGDRQTQLTLSLSCRPAAGPLGSAIDRTVRNRLADAMVLEFVRQLADGIDRLLREPAPA